MGNPMAYSKGTGASNVGQVGVVSAARPRQDFGERLKEFRKAIIACAGC
jgi:hypothetical protein